MYLKKRKQKDCLKKQLRMRIRIRNIGENNQNTDNKHRTSYQL